MNRKFNDQYIEILAPCGNLEVFKEVIQSHCDAVYMGGQNFNMRLLRQGYNFTHEEIKEAIQIANTMNKKLYITLNNLLDDTDLEQVKDYLLFLNEVRPHALIIQDVAMLKLVKELKITIPIHGSVMLNAHNVQTLKSLKKQGVERIVLSQKVALHEVKLIKSQVDMEIEYFIHGKAHGAVCYYSAMLFGLSGNRGKCLMPCKWDYEIEQNGKKYKAPHALRVAEANMYRQIPEMIDAGITSFKIEGRMKDAQTIITLVNHVAEAINRYLDNPLTYDCESNADYMDQETQKDFENPRKFSEPKEESELTSERIKVIKQSLGKEAVAANKVALAVRVNDMESAQMCIDQKVDEIYLSGEVYAPAQPFSLEQIKKLADQKGESKLYLALPRLMNDQSLEKYRHLLSKHDLGIDGLLITNLGAIEVFKGLKMSLIGDTALNILNNKAGEFYIEEGLERIAISLEATLGALKGMLKYKNYPVELVVHGLPVNMYIDHDLTKKLNLETNRVTLSTPKGQYEVYKDQYGKFHKVGSKEINLMPILSELRSQQVSCIRIEGAAYSTEELQTIIKQYQEAIQLVCTRSVYEKMRSCRAGYTLGALQFD